MLLEQKQVKEGSILAYRLRVQCIMEGSQGSRIVRLHCIPSQEAKADNACSQLAFSVLGVGLAHEMVRFPSSLKHHWKHLSTKSEVYYIHGDS